MFSAVVTWLRQLAHSPRLVLVAWALACQIGAGAAVPMQDAAEAQARLAVSVAVFCQSGTHSNKHDGAPIHRHAPDPGLCRVLSTHSHAVAVLDGGVFVPLPRMGGIGGAGAFGARAPPVQAGVAFLARGPPGWV